MCMHMIILYTCVAYAIVMEGGVLLVSAGLVFCEYFAQFSRLEPIVVEVAKSQPLHCFGQKAVHIASVCVLFASPPTLVTCRSLTSTR